MKIPAFALILAVSSAFAADWPTVQHDNQRTAVTAEKIALPLRESWVFEPPFPPAAGWAKPVVGYGAYKNKSNVDFDDCYHVTAVGELAYFASSAENRVYALNVKTGEIVWDFFTDAAPRLAPAIWNGHAYFGADDGRVYCLDALTGKLSWQFDAAPTGEQLLGQGRFGSIRPVRTGVLIDGGVAYFAAGLFPAEGVYLFALEAKSGDLIWRRPLDGRGNEAPSPQGYLLANDDSLFITSRIAPTRWSKADGSAMPFTTPVPHVKDAAYRYHNGGSYALLWNRKNVVYGQAAILAFDPDREYQDTWKRTVKGVRLFNWFNARRIVFRGEQAWLATDDHLICVDSAKLADLAEHECAAFEDAYKKHRVARCRSELEQIAAWGEDSERARAKLNGSLKYALPAYEKWPAVAEELFAAMAKKTRWMTRASAAESMILAGDVLFAGGENGLVAANSATGEILWQTQTGSRVRGLAAANGRLFVSTVDGKVRCFAPGGDASEPTRINPAKGGKIQANPRIALDDIGDFQDREGFALVLGGDPALAADLAEKSRFRVKSLQPAPNEMSSARRILADAGLYGGRVTVSQVSGSKLPFAPYLFNLVVDAGGHEISPAEMLRVTRPFGGVLVRLGQKSAEIELTKEFTAETADFGLKITRNTLTGAKNWTHNYATPANRHCSEDQLVSGPFGISWFGEPGPRKRIERHATPPMPLVVDGIMFLEGYDLLMAYDVYNGVKYWERWIPGVTRQGLPVGVSNLVADDSHLYVVAEYRRCLQLAARTGETVREFPVPEIDGHERHFWGWIAKVGDTIYGSRADADERGRVARGSNHAVFALDAKTGAQRWLRQGTGIDNDSIAIENGLLVYVDRTLTDAEKARALATTVRDDSVEDRPAVDRRGQPIPPDLRKIVAVDADTGEELWSVPFNFTDVTLDDAVSGSHIGFSVLCMLSGEMLVVSGQGSLGHPYKQFRQGEFARRAIYGFEAQSGKLLWGGRKNYRKRPIIVGSRIYAEPHAWELKTGEQVMTVNPLNGQNVPLDFLRGYSGCGHLVASGAALFGNENAGGMAHYNLDEHSGYAPFGNLQLSCGTGAVPAGGVFVAPEGRSGCTCATPIHTSIVLYPGRAQTSAWSFSAGGAEKLDCLPVRRVAVNLGAPGFRTDEAGQLWLPYAGNGLYGRFAGWLPSYQHQPDMFFNESPDLLAVDGGEVPWVYAGGYAAEKDLVFPMLDPVHHQPATYTVRLHFAEPEEIAPGERVFDVALQGKVVLSGYDIVAKAGGARKARVEEIRGVAVTDRLRISLKKSGERAPVLCGFEAWQE